jgi:hypothetical protein
MVVMLLAATMAPTFDFPTAAPPARLTWTFPTRGDAAPVPLPVLAPASAPVAAPPAPVAAQPRYELHRVSCGRRGCTYQWVRVE